MDHSGLDLARRRLLALGTGLALSPAAARRAR